MSPRKYQLKVKTEDGFDAARKPSILYFITYLEALQLSQSDGLICQNIPPFLEILSAE